MRRIVRATRPEIRNGPAARCARGLGDGDRGALEIAADRDHVGEVDADPEPDRRFAPELRVALGHAALDLEAQPTAAAGSANSTSVIGMQREGPPAVAADRRVDQLVLDGRELAVGRLREHLRALVDEVDRQDRGKLLLHRPCSIAGASLGAAS